LGAHDDVAVADAQLRKALSASFRPRRRDGLRELDRKTILISDTVLMYVLQPTMLSIAQLTLLGNLLSVRLLSIGLPSRGVLAVGELRIRSKPPLIILGDAILKCAALESTLDAFVIAVDNSVAEFIQNSRERQSQIRYACNQFETVRIETKRVHKTSRLRSGLQRTSLWHF
jgi:hypothetical protein